MFGFGEPAALAEAQAITAEEIRILNSTLATLRTQIAAKKQR
jgi:hypothetical protein